MISGEELSNLIKLKKEGFSLFLIDSKLGELNILYIYKNMKGPHEILLRTFEGLLTDFSRSQPLTHSQVAFCLRKEEQ